MSLCWDGRGFGGVTHSIRAFATVSIEVDCLPHWPPQLCKDVAGRGRNGAGGVNAVRAPKEGNWRGPWTDGRTHTRAGPRSASTPFPPASFLVHLFVRRVVHVAEG